jgi:DNA repair ATPase RecN
MESYQQFPAERGFSDIVNIMDAADVAADVAESAHHAGSSIVGELGSLGKTMFFQILGKSDNQNLKHHEIKDKKKVDDELSEEEHAAKVAAFYQQYYAQKRRIEKIEEQREEQKEEAEKLEELNEERIAKSQMGVPAEVAKTRSEIGRNFGQE